MNLDINFVIWMFPTLFMLHDFEEIILINAWKKKYAKEIKELKKKRIPFAALESTASFSIAILIEFIVIVSITILSYIFNSYIIWYGAFFGFVVHFIGHFIMQIMFGHYVPGSFTSLIFLPFSCYFLYDMFKILNKPLSTIAFACIIGTLSLFIIIFMLQKFMNQFSLLLERYSNSNI